MAETDINISVPFKSLISSLRRLRYEEKISKSKFYWYLKVLSRL